MCYLKECWEAMSPPFPESDLLGVWCPAIYFSNFSRKKGILYIGKVTRRFLTEGDRFLDSMELDCKKLTYSSIFSHTRGANRISAEGYWIF